MSAWVVAHLTASGMLACGGCARPYAREDIVVIDAAADGPLFCQLRCGGCSDRRLGYLLCREVDHDQLWNDRTATLARAFASETCPACAGGLLPDQAVPWVDPQALYVQLHCADCALRVAAVARVVRQPRRTAIGLYEALELQCALRCLGRDPFAQMSA